MRRSIFHRAAQAVCGLAVVVISADAAAAAAFARMLPHDVQQAAHVIIGAPPPEQVRLAVDRVAPRAGTPSPVASGPASPPLDAPTPTPTPTPTAAPLSATHHPSTLAVTRFRPAAPPTRRSEGLAAAGPTPSMAPPARRAHERPRPSSAPAASAMPTPHRDRQDDTRSHDGAVQAGGAADDQAPQHTDGGDGTDD